MCGHKLTINQQNFTEIIAREKILQKSFGGGGATFLTHTVYFSRWFAALCLTGKTEKTSYFTYRDCDTQPCECPLLEWKKK